MSASMSFYSAYGLTILSELPFPELRAASGTPDITIRRGAVPFTGAAANRTEQFIYGTQTGGFRIREGREIVVDPLPEANEAIVRVVLLGRVMACLLWQRGWFPMHSSGVVINGHAALFVGESGAGKSTLAAALHARGHALVTDDVGPVRVRGGVCEVLPSFARLRLSRESIAEVDTPAFGERNFHVDKYNIELSQGHFGGPVPLRRIYFLDSADELRSEPVPPVAAVASLSAHSFIRRQRYDAESMRIQLRECAALAQAVPVRHLSRPKEFGLLAEVVRAVEEDMSGDS